jgi:hypothetical protein
LSTEYNPASRLRQEVFAEKRRFAVTCDALTALSQRFRVVSFGPAFDAASVLAANPNAKKGRRIFNIFCKQTIVFFCAQCKLSAGRRSVQTFSNRKNRCIVA